MTTQHQALANTSNIARDKAIEETTLLIPKVPVHKLKLLNALAYTMFASGLFLILYVAYLLMWPSNPLVVKSVRVTTPIVTSPGTISYQIDACKNTTLTPTVNRKVVQDNTGFAFPPTQGVATSGCRSTLVTILVPAGISPGNNYVLYSDITYHINAIRDVHVDWHSQSFQIVKG